MTHKHIWIPSPDYLRKLLLLHLRAPILKTPTIDSNYKENVISDAADTVGYGFYIR